MEPDYAAMHCRVLMRDGVALVDKLPTPRFPAEVSKEQQRIEKMYNAQGAFCGENLARENRAYKAMQGHRGLSRGDRSIYTRYLPKES